MPGTTYIGGLCWKATGVYNVVSGAEAVVRASRFTAMLCGATKMTVGS